MRFLPFRELATTTVGGRSCKPTPTSTTAPTVTLEPEPPATEPAPEPTSEPIPEVQLPPLTWQVCRRSYYLGELRLTSLTP